MTQIPSTLLECLRCGAIRLATLQRASCVATSECAVCGYLGWAADGDVDPGERRLLNRRLLQPAVSPRA